MLLAAKIFIFIITKTTFQAKTTLNKNINNNKHLTKNIDPNKFEQRIEDFCCFHDKKN